MPNVTINPNLPPDTGESPGLGAQRIREIKQAVLDLLNLQSGIGVAAPLTMNRVGPLTNRTGGGLIGGDVVALSLSDDASVVLADTQSAARTYVVAAGTIANNDAGVFGQIGQAFVRVFGAVTRGNYLRKSATSLSLEDAGVAQTAQPPSGTLGVALSAAAGPGDGIVEALLWGSTRSLGTPDLATYGVSPSASAATNRAGLQAAIDALPATGGILQFNQYGIHIDAVINVTKPLKIVGPGTTEVSTPGTFVLYLDTASQVGFNVTAKGPFAMQDMSIRGASGAIHVVIDGPTGPGTHTGTHWARVDNCVFYEGSIFVDIRNAVFYAITRSGFFGHTSAGVKIQNTGDGDQGDSVIGDGCVFSTTPAVNRFGVLYLSGGGLKVIGNKFLGGYAGIAVSPTPTASDPNTISDLIIEANSIEQFFGYGIFLTRDVGVTLAPSQIHIVNNQIAANTGGGLVCIGVTPADGAAAYNRIIINGNILTNTATAMQLRRCTNLVVAGNMIEVTGAVYDVDGTVVNVDAGPNDHISFGSFVTGTPGAGFLVKGHPQLTVAQLPAGAETGSNAFATNALGPGDGGYTGYGMTATATGSGAPVFKQGAIWKA